VQGLVLDPATLCELFRPILHLIGRRVLRSPPNPIAPCKANTEKGPTTKADGKSSQQGIHLVRASRGTRPDEKCRNEGGVGGNENVDRDWRDLQVKK